MRDIAINPKDMLIESFRTLKKKHGIDLRNPANNIKVITDDKAYNYYVESLIESFDAKDRVHLRTMMDGTRKTILFENVNSRFGMATYEVLSMPLIPIFYPRLLAKDLVTFATTDKPEIIKPVLKAKFQRYGSSTTYDAPATGADMSNGPAIGSPIALAVDIPCDGSSFPGNPGQKGNLLEVVGLTPDVAHIEKNLIITEVGDGGANWQEVNQVPSVDGHFYFPCTVPTVGDDIVSGKIDYLNGKLVLSSVNGNAVAAKVSCTVSVEENTVSTKMSIEVDKIPIRIVDRELEVDYTIQQKMDIKALYDIDLEAMLLNLMGKQIALDIDRQILTSLTNVVYQPALVPATHIKQFQENPPAGFDWGPKMWHENLVTPVNKLSATISNDTFLGEGNILAANTIDAALFRDWNTYRADFDREGKTTIGYKAAEISGGAQTVLDSPLQTQGKILMAYKPSPAEEEKTVFYLVMHTPGIVQPYPKGNKPSFSVLTRYGTAFIHHKGLGVIEIT